MIYGLIIIIVLLLVLLVVAFRKFNYYYSNVVDTYEEIESFREHLEMVHDLEMFYGDDTLGSLIEHSKKLSDFLGDSQQMISLNEKEYTDYVKSQEDQKE